MKFGRIVLQVHEVDEENGKHTGRVNISKKINN